MEALVLSPALLFSGASAIIAAAATWGVMRYQTADMARRLERLEDRQVKFELKVVSEFVTTETLGQIESRLLTAIERLGDRLDRVLDRSSG